MHARTHLEPSNHQPSDKHWPSNCLAIASLPTVPLERKWCLQSQGRQHEAFHDSPAELQNGTGSDCSCKIASIIPHTWCNICLQTEAWQDQSSKRYAFEGRTDPLHSTVPELTKLLPAGQAKAETQIVPTCKHIPLSFVTPCWRRGASC